MDDFNIEFDSEETQEAADPADDIGAKDQETAAPDETPEAEQGEKEVAPAEQPQQKEKTDQDAAYAAIRRRAEAEAALKYETQMRELQQKAERAETLAKIQGFKSVEDMQKAGINQRLNEGLDADTFSAMVQQAVNASLSQHPVIQDVQKTRAQEAVDRALAEFKREHPEVGIEKVDDFLKLPHVEEFNNLVFNRNMTFTEAYRQSHFNEIVQHKMAAGKQAALNAATSKGHLKPTANDGGADDVTIPRDAYAYYKQMMPEWTDKQIREHYKKSEGG